MTAAATMQTSATGGVGRIDAPLADNQAVIWWLGQAGFAIRSRDSYLMIDPYLSDHLAHKYAGTELSHVRMMQAPIAPNAIRDLGFVLCTHRHSDHMDPGTLPLLQANNPWCLFAVPRAEREHALGIGLEEERVLGMDDGESVDLGSGIRVTAVAAAHEELSVNEKGENRFLGYIVSLGELRIYHSGDTVPYEGLEDRLAGKGIHVALLPINGRDEYRHSRNIAGNLTFAEAVSLCEKAAIPHMIGHHFGMFEFNTVEAGEICNQLETMDTVMECHLPAIAEKYEVCVRRPAYGL
jgi:L-ascorbate metabolism protein UlaG (beta-lactamase superfamily)